MSDDDLFDNDLPTIDSQIRTQGHHEKCPICDEYTYIPAYWDNPVECDKCDSEFNVPGGLG